MKRYPSGIMATCCIPWDENGQFAEAIFRRGMHTMLTLGTKHLYVFERGGMGMSLCLGKNTVKTSLNQIPVFFLQRLRLNQRQRLKSPK